MAALDDAKTIIDILWPGKTGAEIQTIVKHFLPYNAAEVADPENPTNEELATLFLRVAKGGLRAMARSAREGTLKARHAEELQNAGDAVEENF